MSYLKAKMHNIRFRLGSAPYPAEGAYSAPRTLTWILGAYFYGKRGRTDEREGQVRGEKRGDGMGKGGNSREREGERTFRVYLVPNLPVTSTTL